MRLLLVEDYADAATTMAILLWRLGHEVRTACSGKEALDAVEADKPDAVLLDIGLPDIDGYEVAKRMKAGKDGDAPFLIALTGYGQDSDRRHAFEAGFDLYLLKPVSAAQLTVALQSCQELKG